MTFEQAVKAVNSDWYVGTSHDAINDKGELFEKLHIVGGHPDLKTCQAIAKYSGYRYWSGYFYKLRDNRKIKKGVCYEDSKQRKGCKIVGEN